ncbi:MAG: hypothetical protein KBC12_01700 [Candidatus Pacebacteria bacterium]|nr:hypothetical protein [Candidatus Paceibacterota bacterium]MBP9851401.1 hypothetical protein [Candidatus Paceibacterota bacterium]
MKQLNRISLLLAMFILPALGFAQTLRDSLQADSLKKVAQGPCPSGMVFVSFIQGDSTTEKQVGEPMIIDEQFFPGFKWTECVSGKVHDRAPRKSRTYQQDVFYFAYRADTVYCAIVREVVKKEKWVTVECEIDTLDRTPVRKDSAYIIPKGYVVTQFNVPHHSPKAEFAIGGCLTQYYLQKSSDSLAPWMQRFFQFNVRAESSLAADEVVDPYVITCDTCTGIKKKEPKKIRIGSVNTISLLFEIRGNHELRPVSRIECRGYLGMKYYITEVHEGRTVNRGEDGFVLVMGFGAFSPKSLWILKGAEFNIQLATRPFLNWQTQANLRMLVHLTR